ncbi:uncharacterized protein DS421_6g191750 [Arachis hypogaea]|nr:uncharacterized protein DS421_6g191750 [Arachis hypogaea]
MKKRKEKHKVEEEKRGGEEMGRTVSAGVTAAAPSRRAGARGARSVNEARICAGGTGQPLRVAAAARAIVVAVGPPGVTVETETQRERVRETEGERETESSRWGKQPTTPLELLWPSDAAAARISGHCRSGELALFLSPDPSPELLQFDSVLNPFSRVNLRLLRVTIKAAAEPVQGPPLFGAAVLSLFRLLMLLIAVFAFERASRGEVLIFGDFGLSEKESVNEFGL